jgi:hypothetical protein
MNHNIRSKRNNSEPVAPLLLAKPSPYTRKFFLRISAAAESKPILDVAAGSGRNAIPFLQSGCTVVCVDKDLKHLRSQRRLLLSHFRIPRHRLILEEVDLLKEKWPFGASCLGGIINIHFFIPALLPFFAKSLTAGGYLLLETPPGCGGNYVELPKAGEVRAMLSERFTLDFYKESEVGPRQQRAVAVQLLAKRRA